MNETKTDACRSEERRTSLLCPMCETADLIQRHCKTMCPGCGYVESCEDNFVPNEANPNE